MRLEILGYDEGPDYRVLDDTRAKLSRGKGRARASHEAGAAAQVPNVSKVSGFAES